MTGWIIAAVIAQGATAALVLPLLRTSCRKMWAVNSEDELRAKIKAYADRLSSGRATDTEPAAVAATLRLILVGVHDPRPVKAAQRPPEDSWDLPEGISPWMLAEAQASVKLDRDPEGQTITIEGTETRDE